MANALNNCIDIKENYIYQLDKSILDILLKDRTSGKNIIWATDMYSFRGEGYLPQDYITAKAITGLFGNVIKPRIKKSQREQRQRVKSKAEVFTPSWICNSMANSLDETWFDRTNVFNVQQGKSWTATADKISFPNGKTWQDYVQLKVIEITCGEAPFLASRYDTVTGKWLNVSERIGLLDRKLRIVGENVDTEPEWVRWAYQAYKSTYGYEWQGDSVLIARENLLFTFIDYYVDKFENFPINEYLIELSKIISWNIWQMDGLKNTIPVYAKQSRNVQMEIDFSDENGGAHTDGFSCGSGLAAETYCKIKNWQTNHTVKFDNIKITVGNNKGENKMKFDFVIGNPPYQIHLDDTSDKPVYHSFMDASFKVSDKVELITPARFLFNNGKTSKEWNEKILQDKHFKVLRYEPDSKKMFNGVDIKGGVAITYHNNFEDYGAIGTFTAFEELNSILHKVKAVLSSTLADIIYPTNRFNLDVLYIDFPELRKIISSDGNERRLTSGCLSKLNCFSENRMNEDDVKILGVISNKRVYRYIPKKYIDFNHQNLCKYKVMLPGNNGSGAIGEVLSAPLIGTPLIGYTQTFISIGAFDTEKEAANAMKYIKGKFARAMLSVLKITQNGKKEMWRYIPIQDFTSNSDIDWSKSIAEIDQQLYKKYGLSADEINFIETHIKEMD